ncbi:MAG: hypothetical protein SFT68_03835 [Rickettsiaceae bacterium]|nr:hypothetical protein [Rickettsiaceae bacterium]
MFKLIFILISLIISGNVFAVNILESRQKAINSVISSHKNNKTQDPIAAKEQKMRAQNQPIMTHSHKVIMNQIIDQITYVDKVRVEFDEYYLITEKMILNMYKKPNGDKYLKNGEFPEQLKIISKDQKEIVIAPNATFDAQNSTIKAKGEGITVEKDGQLYSTDYIEIKLGKYKALKRLSKPVIHKPSK